MVDGMFLRIQVLRNWGHSSRLLCWGAVCLLGLLLVVDVPAQPPVPEPKPAATKTPDAEPKAIELKPAESTESEEVEFLLNPKEFPKGWQCFTAEGNTPLEMLWQVAKDQDPKDAILICTGRVDGYLRTEREYENFELTLEWKYPTDPNGNSGILLHTVEKNMIWPKGVQVQLHRPTAGSIFPSSGAKIDNALPAKDLSLPVNEWNTCVITSVGDRLSVSVNQKKVGEVTGCLPQKGAIGLQSEGSEIHFRRIKIRQLPAMELSRNPTRRRAMSAVSPEKVFEPIELCPPGWAIKRWNGHAVKALSPKQEATRAKQEAQRTLRLLKRQELTWVPRVAPGVHPTVSPTFEFLRAPAFAPVP